MYTRFVSSAELARTQRAAPANTAIPTTVAAIPHAILADHAARARLGSTLGVATCGGAGATAAAGNVTRVDFLHGACTDATSVRSAPTYAENAPSGSASRC